MDDQQNIDAIRQRCLAQQPAVVRSDGWIGAEHRLGAVYSVGERGEALLRRLRELRQTSTENEAGYSEALMHVFFVVSESVDFECEGWLPAPAKYELLSNEMRSHARRAITRCALVLDREPPASLDADEANEPELELHDAGTLASVLSSYYVRSSDVRALLVERPDIVDLLSTVHGPARAAFDAGALSLDVLADPETGAQQLLVLAPTSLSPEDAVQVLHGFYSDWWSIHAVDVGEDVILDVEYK